MIWEIVALAIAILMAVILFIIVKRIVILFINSVIGVFALIGFNYLFETSIAINFWSVLITAIGGILGLVTVVVLYSLRLAFV